MYDLIASWMTSGGPLQELRRDERGRIRPTVADVEPATEPDRHGHRPSFAFARGLRATALPDDQPHASTAAPPVDPDRPQARGETPMTDLLVTPTTDDPLVDEVRAHYAEAARAVLDRAPEATDATACCGPSGDAVFGEALYSELDRAELPDAAVLASLGCGNPTAVAELREGEVVLDLGSGGGIDVLLSARRVGPTRLRLRPRHDRRDARAGAPQRGRGRRDERRVPEGPDRGDPPPRRLGRRRHQQLRHQPVDRQGRRPGRDRPRPATGRPDGRQRCRLGRRPDSCRARRPGQLRRLHRRGAVVRRVSRRARGASG